MKMKNKSLFLGLGSATLVGFTTISVVSCSTNSNTDGGDNKPEDKVVSLSKATFEVTKDRTTITIEGQNLDGLKAEDFVISQKTKNTKEVITWMLDSANSSSTKVVLFTNRVGINLDNYSISLKSDPTVSVDTIEEVAYKYKFTSASIRWDKTSKNVTIAIEGENLSDIKDPLKVNVFNINDIDNPKKVEGWKLNSTSKGFNLVLENQTTFELGSYTVSLVDYPNVSIDVNLFPTITSVTISRDQITSFETVTVEGDNLQGIKEESQVNLADISSGEDKPYKIEGFTITSTEKGFEMKFDTQNKLFFGLYRVSLPHFPKVFFDYEFAPKFSDISITKSASQISVVVKGVYLSTVSGQEMIKIYNNGQHISSGWELAKTQDDLGGTILTFNKKDNVDVISAGSTITVEYQYRVGKTISISGQVMESATLQKVK